MPAITPWLWFDTEGEEAAEFSTSVSPTSKQLQRCGLVPGQLRGQDEVDHY